MINLIPPHARKQVKVEYWARVVSVWLFLVALALGIVAVLLVPSYVLIYTQLTAYEAPYNNAVESDASYKELQTAVGVANREARQLLVGEGDMLFTNLLDEIELLSGDSIHVNTITMERADGGVVKEVQLQGVADSRLALATYRDAIEAHAFFKSAALPIANLAKDKDVPFNITAVLVEQE